MHDAWLLAYLQNTISSRQSLDSKQESKKLSASPITITCTSNCTSGQTSPAQILGQVSFDPTQNYGLHNHNQLENVASSCELSELPVRRHMAVSSLQRLHQQNCPSPRCALTRNQSATHECGTPDCGPASPESEADGNLMRVHSSQSLLQSKLKGLHSAQGLYDCGTPDCGPESDAGTSPRPNLSSNSTEWGTGSGLTIISRVRSISNDWNIGYGASPQTPVDRKKYIPTLVDFYRSK